MTYLGIAAFPVLYVATVYGYPIVVNLCGRLIDRRAAALHEAGGE